MRLANAGPHDALVTVAGTDDLGLSPGAAVPAGAAAELESGNAAAIIGGALGDGAGAWRLSIAADAGTVSAMSLLPGPMGALSNLSGAERAPEPGM